MSIKVDMMYQAKSMTYRFRRAIRAIFLSRKFDLINSLNRVIRIFCIKTDSKIIIRSYFMKKVIAVLFTAILSADFIFVKEEKSFEILALNHAVN